MIRIIGGSAKGRKLQGPRGYMFRPTTGRVKEFVFSVLGEKVEGAAFLDLFSGAGSFGIEAISRGAGSVVFVDRARQSIDILRHNIDLCSFSENSRIVRGDVFRKVRAFEQEGLTFDVILADPPFKGMFRQKIAVTVGSTGILKKPGLLVIEHERHDEDSGGHGLHMVRQKNFGGSVVSFYSHGGSS